MNSFLSDIKNFESDHRDTYDIKIGKTPVIITSAHGIEQRKRGGKIKFAETFTRAIAKYLNKKTGCYYLIKNEDTGIDPNRKNDDEFKTILLDIIEKNHIKLSIDLHGAKKERDFDIEIGTLDGKTANNKTIKELIDCFSEQGLKNIVLNDPFKGGYITRAVYKKGNIECVQIEINQKIRSIRKINDLKKICKALEKFILRRSS